MMSFTMPKIVALGSKRKFRSLSQGAAVMQRAIAASSR